MLGGKHGGQHAEIAFHRSLEGQLGLGQGAHVDRRHAHVSVELVGGRRGGGGGLRRLLRQNRSRERKAETKDGQGQDGPLGEHGEEGMNPPMLLHHRPAAQWRQLAAWPSLLRVIPAKEPQSLNRPGGGLLPPAGFHDGFHSPRAGHHASSKSNGNGNDLDRLGECVQ